MRHSVTRYRPIIAKKAEFIQPLCHQQKAKRGQGINQRHVFIMSHYLKKNLLILVDLLASTFPAPSSAQAGAVFVAVSRQRPALPPSPSPSAPHSTSLSRGAFGGGGVPSFLLPLFAKSPQKERRDERKAAAEIVARSKRSTTKSQNDSDGGEGDDWRNVRVLSSRPACRSGKSTVIEVEVDAKTQREYTVPGQFVQFRHSESTPEPIFLAMSSAPSSSSSSSSPAPTFEFLIKMSPRLPWLKDALIAGNTVQISSVAGSGFPVANIGSEGDDATTDRYLLAAAGSGIAPIKACIESGMIQPRPPSPQQQHQQFNSTFLYYGEWTSDDLCFSEHYDRWQRTMGVTVVPVLSRSSGASDGGGYYVQQALQQDRVLSSPGTTGAILCGMDDMVQSVTSVLAEAGVERRRILLNL